MNDYEVFKSYVLNEFNYKASWTNDNSNGITLHYIGFMKNGNGKLVSRKEIIELNKGDMFYIPKGCKYVSHWKTTEENALFDSIGFMYFPNNKNIGYKLQKINYTKEIFDLYKPLYDSKEVNLKSISTLYSVLSELSKIMETEPVEHHQQIINTAFELMKSNPQFTIPEIALSCGVCESSLYNIFKQKLGKTPNTIRQELMCNKAAELLRITNLSIEQISSKTGFSSSSYFRKIFYSVYKTSPRKYRKESEILL